MPKISPADAATKWAQNGAAAGARWSQGIQNTNKDIVGLALAAEDRMLAGVQQAVSSGHWRRKLGAVGTAGVKQAVAKKSGNYATGINAGKDKAQAAFTALFAYEDALENAVAQMPRGTDADSEARMLAWSRGMRQYKTQQA